MLVVPRNLILRDGRHSVGRSAPDGLKPPNDRRMPECSWIVVAIEYFNPSLLCRPVGLKWALYCAIGG